MGRSTKRKDDKGADKKRKRRKKARTDVSSDSDSSSSSSEDEVMVKKTVGRKADASMDDAAVAPASVPAMIEDEESDHDDDEAAESTVAGKPSEKSGQIPLQLRDFRDSQADAKFEDYYMRLVTEEFGDDINNFRSAKDFGDKSLPLLIKALKQGINIFSADEKMTVVKELD
ncbi:uncharacterized protein LAJ45_09959 [Morchella importuna]|uniref:Ribosome assembly protein 3 n=1 Tax=Morchella conica CCBAS932 TaxID=1392247 RepID=A0A3N4L4E7_9PEZI|nr:uncharacterized protein LAJ45_09959 [Morchella importuna]KAH8146037.1 hypothetical protein LAJ45_09959 [Morchella importuna]RPB17784.1 hypothetical protein P167DRAFT_601577 [Morchella conica CCBAS932]